MYSLSYYSSRLEKLIENAYSAQWALDSSDSGIPWDQEPTLPQDIAVEDYIDMISQLYYAEHFTIQICSKLVSTLKDFQAVRFLCTQMADESRHARAYVKYIELFGKVAPVNEQLKEIFEEALSWNGSPYALIVGQNIVLEGEALAQQKKRIESLPCPIFKQINEKIIQDEFRHAHFGLTYLRDKLKYLDVLEKHQILKWIENLWKKWEKAHEGRYLNAQQLVTSSGELKERLANQKNTFQMIGLLSRPVATGAQVYGEAGIGSY